MSVDHLISLAISLSRVKEHCFANDKEKVFVYVHTAKDGSSLSNEPRSCRRIMGVDFNLDFRASRQLVRKVRWTSVATRSEDRLYFDDFVMS